MSNYQDDLDHFSEAERQHKREEEDRVAKLEEEMKTKLREREEEN